MQWEHKIVKDNNNVPMHAPDQQLKPTLWDPSADAETASRMVATSEADLEFRGSFFFLHLVGINSILVDGVDC